ncbi:MAG: hypothetical protein WD826_01640, partial [Actinomycetota bacterium]
AARWEPDGPVTESTGLALHPNERVALVDEEVVTKVLTEGEKYAFPTLQQASKHHSGCLIADGLGMWALRFGHSSR